MCAAVLALRCGMKISDGFCPLSPLRVLTGRHQARPQLLLSLRQLPPTRLSHDPSPKPSLADLFLAKPRDADALSAAGSCKEVACSDKLHLTRWLFAAPHYSQFLLPTVILYRLPKLRIRPLLYTSARLAAPPIRNPGGHSPHHQSPPSSDSAQASQHHLQTGLPIMQ